MSAKTIPKKSPGTVRVNGEVDNEKVSIEFDQLRVRTPILSVRKLVRDDHEIYIKRVGGNIRNTTSGKQIKFCEHAGAYYPELKITPQSIAMVTTMVLVGRKPELQLQSGA